MRSARGLLEGGESAASLWRLVSVCPQSPLRLKQGTRRFRHRGRITPPINTGQ